MYDDIALASHLSCTPALWGIVLPGNRLQPEPCTGLANHVVYKIVWMCISLSEAKLGDDCDKTLGSDIQYDEHPIQSYGQMT